MRRRGSLPPIRPGLAKSLENQALVYFSGITLAILEPPARKVLLDAVSAARKAGSLVAFDANYRPRLWQSPDIARAAIDEALSVIDIALPTFPDEQNLYGDASPEATAERLSAAGVGEIVVKNGEFPATIRHGGTAETISAVHVPSPVDTTGAGDSFNGSYLAARLAGLPPAGSDTQGPCRRCGRSCRCVARWRHSRRCARRSLRLTC